MSLPIILPVGVVSVYGPGNTTSVNGIVAPTAFRFGYVDQVYDGCTIVTEGDHVMFNGADMIAKLTYLNWPYLLFNESKLVTENPPL